MILAITVAAYKVSAESWGPGFGLDNWLWPMDQLEQHEPFSSLDPWCVLFREAVYLSRRYMLNLPLEARPHEDQDA